MRTGVTLADVARAADQLLADGERPTVEGVRKFLGTGSPATVNNLLKDYYQALPARLNMPAAIATAATDLYKVIRGTALQEVQDEHAARLQEVERDRARLATDRKAYESERESLQQQVASLQSDKAALQEQRSQLQNRATQLERQLAEVTERAASAKTRATAASEERERAATKHAHDLQHVRDQADGNERHLLARIEDLKTQAKTATAAHEKEVGALQKRVGTLETILSDQAKDAAAARTTLAGAQREIQVEKEARATAESTLQRERDLHAKDVQTADAEKGRLRRELEEAAAASRKLKQERDYALRDAARLEGTVQTLSRQRETEKKGDKD